MASPRVGRILMLNPLGPILEGLRLVMTNAAPVLSTTYSPKGLLIWSPWYLVCSGLVAIALLLVGLVAFRRSATMFAEYY